MIFLFNWVMFSLQPFIFQGCFLSVGRNATSIMVDVPIAQKRQTTRSRQRVHGYLFPTANFPQFQDGIFLVKGLRNFDVKIAGHPKAVVQKYIRNLMEKPGKKSTSLSFCWNRIFKDGS